MIECVLNRDFVLANARAALRELNAPPDPDERRSADPLAAVEPAQRKETSDALTYALDQEAAASSYSGNSERAASERRGEAPLTDWAFLSHDPVISIVQSALDEQLRSKGAVNEVEAHIDDDRRGVRERIAVTTTGLKGVTASIDDDRRIFNAFSQTDPRWVASLVAKGIQWFKGKHAFPPCPAATLNIAPNARVVLVGDWASGLPRARGMAKDIIRQWIDDASDRERHVIHLGDIYYSGWPKESQERFLNPWPVDESQACKIGSWCLNGNHDMYSGGFGYFDTVLADTRFTRQDHSNRFVLRHPKWEIIGVDTAWEDDDLAGDQASWVDGLLRNSNGRKGMLLSHHQLFSAYESGSKHLGERLRGTLEDGLIRSWFWGHEHRCAIYEPCMGVEYARCIGHGGVPVYQWRNDKDPVKDPASYEFRGAFTTTAGIERWAEFGFAVLDFSAEGPIRAYYVDEAGRTGYGEQRDQNGNAYEIIQ